MRDPRDESLHKHREWLGYLQPVGLVVSPPALVESGCYVNADVAEDFLHFTECTADGRILNFRQLVLDVFGWKAGDLVPADDPRAAELIVPLQNYGEILRPTFAVPGEPGKPWVMLIQEVAAGLNLDSKGEEDGRKWHASPIARFERLLRETQIPVGLLSNATELRLVYAPRGESLGHLAFPIPVLLAAPGRLAFAALVMLLRESRVFGSTGGKTLSEVLAESRKYQNTVSTELARQVLAALYELVRGIQAADAHRKGELLRNVLAKDPDSVYAGMTTVLLRLVFLLYAEDRGLMVEDEVYTRHYSVTGLFDKLRNDHGRNPDTMDQRYGAWAQLVSLFRIVHDGAEFGTAKLLGRRGYLFSPDRYPFLEGRPLDSRYDPAHDPPLAPPMIADGVVFRVLRNLMILDGERLSYRALAVEHIGSVYEGMMGFRVEVAQGPSIAVKPKKTHGAAVALNLDELLAQKPAERAKFLKERTDQAATGESLTALKEAKTPEDVVAALGKKVAAEVTPNIVPVGSVVLQPSEERRRSGSHYTPRDLTRPIVEKALQPVLAQFGAIPTPAQILALKICDPAMGSGAFLVETCLQLAELLVKSWNIHGGMPKIPADEDELRHAQRLIAQRCLYGVDKNPMAVDLAKLSLWLTTLAKAHPFTFLDHALREGDALVGLSMRQIRLFHWDPGEKVQQVFGYAELERRVKNAEKLRGEIHEAGDAGTTLKVIEKFQLAEEALGTVRFAGNLCIAAFFSATKDKDREKQRENYSVALNAYLQTHDMKIWPGKQVDALLKGEQSLKPFHWEIEFPEVFEVAGEPGRASARSKQAEDSGRSRDPARRGFDALVGNPPFAGKNTIGEGNRPGYLDWLKVLHEESHGNADLVAHFFRRAFDLLRPGGTFGLIATNTIAQGDTRSSGLRWICTHGGTIFHARRRMKWPGMAAVVVSVIHIQKNDETLAATRRVAAAKRGNPPTVPALRSEDSVSRPRFLLDGKPVERITAYLFHAGGHDDPARLAANAGKSFQGSIVLGMGFTFDDTDKSGVANPLSLMHELIAKDPRNAERIFPYIGGEETNNHPEQKHNRYVINFGDMDEKESRNWPRLVNILESSVKPARAHLTTNDIGRKRAKFWWQYGGTASELYEAIAENEFVLAINCGATPHVSFVKLPRRIVFANTLAVFSLDSLSSFAVLQCRVHEVWARFFASSMKDDLRYTPSDCFETFPFPRDFESDADLEAIGKEYYEFRAALMIRNDEGLTKTYNRFHDPYERQPDILKLRELHAAMDAVVLRAYGPPFSELTVPPCQFLLDYEDDEDEEESVGKRQKKKPWRFRWPDEFRDQVLALLLELNKERAALEAAAPAKAKKPKKGKKTADEGDGDLF